jgi:hypothetical protein
MSDYKFQVAIDGYGTSWDGTFWKLRSNSVVFWLTSGVTSSHQPLWLPFYWPLLKEYVHYIPATAYSVRHYHSWCQLHLGQCSAIAGAAARVMHQKVTAGMILEYMKRLLIHLQQWSITSHCF